MKPQQIKTIKTVLFVSTLLLNASSFANQTSHSESLNAVQSNSWYLQPWLWSGAAVFLGVLVVSALRGRLKG